MKFFDFQGCHNDDYQCVLAWDLPRLLPQLPVSSPHTDSRGQHEGRLQTRRIQCFDWACWFFKMRGFDNMCMGFLLLRLDYTLTDWRSIFFIGHVVTAVFLVTGMSLRKKSKSVGEENKPKLN